jgi:hypothetical protein
VVPSVFLFPHDESFVVSQGDGEWRPGDEREEEEPTPAAATASAFADGRRSQLLRRPNRDQADAGRGRASRVSGGLS